MRFTLAVSILRAIPVRPNLPKRLPPPPLVPRDLELLLAPPLGVCSSRPACDPGAVTVRP